MPLRRQAPPRRPTSAGGLLPHATAMLLACSASAVMRVLFTVYLVSTALIETALGLRRLLDFGIADKAGAPQNLNGTDLKRKPLFLSGVAS